MRTHTNLTTFGLLFLAGFCASCAPAGIDETDEAVQETAAVTPVLVYVMDCGFITMMNPENYDLRPEEITGSGDFVTPCYLIEHPEGTLVYDVGQIPDAEFPEDGSTAVSGVFASQRPLLPQIAEIGYEPGDITYMAMSHYHTDHSANANSFAGSTWIVQQAERDAMFGGEGPGLSTRSFYDQL